MTPPKLYLSKKCYRSWKDEEYVLQTVIIADIITFYPSVYFGKQ